MNGLDALLAPEGQSLLAEVAQALPAADGELQLITRLRRHHPQELVAAALTQAKLRIRARSKFTHADRMYFTQAGLEQASSERMARHHAERYAPFDLVADLCTGIGGDLIGLADGRAAIAVDKDPVHAHMALLNAAANGVGERVTSVCADVRDVRLDDVGAVFVDPARRSSDRRFAAGTSEPSLDWCFALADRGVAMGIKAAPGLPTELVPAGWELEFVSEHRDLKESVLWSPALATTQRRATLLPERLTLVEQAGASLPVQAPGTFLLDPDPAVTRAGLVEELGQSLGDVWKVDERIAFLSADFAMDTPFGRTLRIEASAPWSLARLRETLRSLDIGTVDIRKRGSAVDVDEIQRKLKLTGGRAATVVLTRVSDQPWMMVCSDV
ncbi:MAG: hypothetical protein JWM41_2649 [Gemmatimonadetes bacterium]|nr:hypothetical protein [Gemmatimonadota bacterium]